MSPVSRRRKGKQNKRSTTRRPVARTLASGRDECACPACSGAYIDPRELVDQLVAGGADLLDTDDPLDAELLGALFVSTITDPDGGFDDALIDRFVPELEARACPEALAMMLAIASVALNEAGTAAKVAADRLVAAGVASPGWAAEVDEPVTVGDCWRLSDSQSTGSLLACSFHRAGRSHAVMMSVDHLTCGAATDIHLFDADQLPHALEVARAGAGQGGMEITTEELDAAEFRWRVEAALDARAVHDADEQPDHDATDASAEQDGPGYPTLATLLRARMNTLPLSNKPTPPHGGEDGPGRDLSLLQMVEQLAASGGGLRGGRTVAKLPPKRKKSNGPAPVYQLKVGLQDAEPPIWRRLEVPADMSLARLHVVIQTAFGWDDSHMHVFETPYGEFGLANADLGYRAEGPVTLEQVAPEPGSTVRYTYDFGDDWIHDIQVEKVLDRDQSATYPRCAGGRRAAPPEDCGGVWGYADLVEILGDPTDPEHAERLEWLGLDDAAAFTPDRFDAEEVNRVLSALR